MFGLGLRDVEPTLAERGTTAAHGSVRRRCLKSGSESAARPRRRRPRPGDTWHPDEVFLRIDGVLRHPWRAVDQHGAVLGVLVQGRRNAAAAKRFLKRLLRGLKYRPRRIIAGGPRSCGAAKREVLPHLRHRTGRHLNDRAENPRRPTRRRGRRMQRLKPPEQAQRLLAARAMICGHVRPRRHRTTAARCRRARAEAFRVWRQGTRVQTAA
jgi:putative transposase